MNVKNNTQLIHLQHIQYTPQSVVTANSPQSNISLFRRQKAFFNSQFDTGEEPIQLRKYCN